MNDAVGAALVDGGRTAAGPLAGLRVIELGELVAGPFVGTLLGEFGAEVIKVERPGDGDILRRFGPMVAGKGLFWESNARNKRSVVIDLKHADGKAVLLDLLARSDVFVSSLRPGALADFGLDPDEIERRYPRLVVVNVSAFGMSGPNAHKGGYDPVAQGFSGLSFITGEGDGPPLRAGGPVPVCDFMTGLAGAFAAVLALYGRDAGGFGRGQTADLGLYDMALRMLGPLLSNFDLTGQVWQRDGNHSLGGAPTGHFQTRDGHWICTSVQNDGQFRRLAVLIGREDWIGDPWFATLDRRTKRWDAIETIVASWIRERSREEVLSAFTRAGLGAGAIHSVADLALDPHVNQRGVRWEEDPELGSYRTPTVFPMLSGTPGRVAAPAPHLGQDSIVVLRDLLGYREDMISTLTERGIIVSATESARSNDLETPED